MDLANEEISRAVAIFRTAPNMQDKDIFGALVKQGMKPELAARTVEFLPMAYCRLILSESGARFSNTFRRIAPGHEAQEKPLLTEPVWQAIMKFGHAEVERGVSRSDLLLVAAHGAEFQTANQLLNAGSQLKDLAFTAPVLTWPEQGPELSHVP